jgi:mxaJ protein
VAWGPLAGYFAQRSSVPLEIVPVSPAVDPPGLRFTFDISLAVRPDDSLRLKELDRILERKHSQVEGILRDYGVPLVPAAEKGAP